MKDWIVRIILLSFLGPGAAQAQTSEAPLGHPQIGSKKHWYPWECCSGNDCSPMPMKIENDHYVWDSWRFPGVTFRVPVDGSNGTKIKPSEDGSYHVCEGKRNGKYVALCVFVPGGI